MQNFDYISPTYFAFGRDTENRAGELCRRFGAGKVLLHYGQGSVIRSGLLDRVKKSLDAADIPYVELGGVVPNPRLDMVREGIDFCREHEVDFILAVGAGSAIDSAKAIAVGVPNERDIWEIWENGIPVDEVLPVATVLTLPATGSEASRSSVITNEETKQKYGYGTDQIRPVFSIMNPELTFTLPPFQTACGIMDMIAHILERYFSPTQGVNLTDRMMEGTLKAIIRDAEIVMREPVNYDARANIMWAGTIAHNNILGVGRLQDWASHAIEHELSALYDVAHGAGLAVVFPAFMRYTMEQDIPRFQQFAVNVFNIDNDFRNPEVTALKGIEAFERFIKEVLELPLTLEELGGDPKDIPWLAEHCRFKSELLGNFKPLTREDVAEILKLTL